MNEERERYERKKRGKHSEHKPWVGVIFMGVFFIIMYVMGHCSHYAHLVMPE